MSAGTPRPAAVWPLRWPGRRRSALSESLWQRAGAEGAAAAARTPPVRMMSSHGLALSNSLRFLLVVSCASF